MAKIGSWMGPQSPYGVPPNALHPSDNDITPDPAQAEADRLAAQAADLFDELKNAQRNERLFTTPAFPGLGSGPPPLVIG
jgi:hypothetical protein